MAPAGYVELDPLREDQVFLSTVPAGPEHRRRALRVVVVAAIVFLVAAPFSRIPLPAAWAFISVQESALFVVNLITAVLLYGQFAILRSRAMLVLAAGYLYAAVMTIPHLLAFPGIFSPTGLLGDDPQTTAWIYVFWRVGYELSYVAYFVLTSTKPVVYRNARTAIISSLVGVVAAACLLTFFAVAASTVLPALQLDGRYTRTTVVLGVITWSFAVLVLLLFWRRPQKSVLDLWLVVVGVMLLMSAALSALLNTGRFDFGFCFGRLFGLAAASFVLINLLIENSRLYAKLAAGQAELERLTRVDPLTGIANRRAFDAALDAEWRRAARNHTPLSLLLIDVDNFKSFNDLYGHPAGDECLRTIAEVLMRTARRAGETIARVGGEEFTVLLPGIDRAEAASLAQRLCQTVRDLNFPHAASSVAGHVTISVGAASAVPSHEFWDPGPDGLVERADRALYAAKAAGRDRVAEAGEELAKAQSAEDDGLRSLAASPWSRWRKKPL
jgi:diguanylate cyclase (GGDEF)-like protein